ncbi:MAG: hypothetical protein E6P95_00215 [Candidatus Moraniibacteriota bacterium]|nr:MAG: hypothetical protein E6P95_00215 [Candidatus Moranbacteria bacterium]
MNAVQMSVEKRIFPKRYPDRVLNTDLDQGKLSLVGETIALATLEGIIGLREHWYGYGVRTLSTLYVTTDSAQSNAKRLWYEYIDDMNIVYRFRTNEVNTIVLNTTEISLGTRSTLHPSGLVVAKLANIIQLTENQVLHYSNLS